MRFRNSKTLFEVIIIVCLFLISSCDESEEIKSTVFKFRVNGLKQDYSQSQIEISYIRDTVSFLDRTVTEITVHGIYTVILTLFQETDGVFVKDSGSYGNANSIVYSGNSHLEYWSSIYPRSQHKIEITEFINDATVVGGKFSGTLYSALIDSDDSLVITEGEFYVKK